jgi:hypothetical protein
MSIVSDKHDTAELLLKNKADANIQDRNTAIVKIKNFLLITQV